jgi:hypothetical protein
MGISQPDHSLWPAWARFLQRRGLAGVAASLIDVVSPFAFVGAQAIYLGQPIFGPPASASSSQALAALLENRTELQEFAAYLREETTP